MNPRICIYCGEPIPEKGDAHSRNPETCASCSSLSDGMANSSMSDFADFDDQLLKEADAHQIMDVAA